MGFHVTFCTACRIALGKLRRTTNIASSLKKQNANVSLTLLANSGPKGVLHGLTKNEVALFDRIEYARAAEMTDRLKSMNSDVVVVDTMSIGNLHQITAKLCLILREVVPEELRKFRLKEARSWDLVILPHPEGHWMPGPDLIAAKRMESVGWIFRRPDPSSENVRVENPRPTVLITTGGGSGEDRGNDIRSEIGDLIAGLRLSLPFAIHVTEVIGPRDWQNKAIPGIDEVISPGPELHNHLSQADLVISAAGYNSVLELACTDVPVLLTPVPRYTDDQNKRAQLWAPHLGMCYDAAAKDQCMQWMADVLQTRSRRPVVNLGPSGAEHAAARIAELALDT